MNLYDDGPYPRRYIDREHPDPWADVELAQDFYDAFLYDVGDRD